MFKIATVAIFTAVLSGCATTSSNVNSSNNLSPSEENFFNGQCKPNPDTFYSYSCMVYKCKESLYSSDIDLTLMVYQWSIFDEPFSRSAIIFNGEYVGTSYNLSGLDKRWNWGLDEDKNYDYSIIMSPNNIARFYNFQSRSNAYQQYAFSCDVTFNSKVSPEESVALFNKKNNVTQY